MAIDILTGTVRGVSMAVMVADGRAFGPVFDDTADVIGFLRWCHKTTPAEANFLSIDRPGLQWVVANWCAVRHQPECPREGCTDRVKPGHTVCETCEGDDEYEAELAAKGTA